MRSAPFAFLVLAASLLSAQSSSKVEVAAEPHHHLLLQNAYVRVFDVSLPPGEATLLHRHPHDFVVVMRGATQISNQVEGKAPVSAALQDEQIVSGDGGMAHLVRNVGSTPFRNITVELLPDEKARQTPPLKWEEERGLNILEGGTQDILFVKDGVRVSELDLRPGGMIPQHRHVGPHLLIAVSDLQLHSAVAGKGASMIEMKAGDIKWVAGGFTHTLMNMAKQNAKFVTLEFH